MNESVFASLPADRPVRYGIVGLGSAAQLLHLPALAEVSEIELVGLCDAESYKVSMVSEKFGAEGFTEVDQLLEQCEPDVLLICTPTNTHLPIALAALEKGAHVIVEKPVTRSVADTERLAAAAREAERLVLVAMNQRFRSDISLLHNYLEKGALGKLWRIRSGWLKRVERWNHSSWLDEPQISGGGVFMDLGLQLLDVILWQLDYPDLKRVSTFSHNSILGREVEDTVTAMLEVRDGPVIQIDCSWGLRAEQDVAYTYIEGTRAAARLPGLTLTQLGKSGLEIDSPVKHIPHHDLYSASFRTQHQQYVKMLRGEIPPVSTVDEAVRVMQVVDLVYRSARDGQEIQG